MKIDCNCTTCQAYLLGYSHGATTALTEEAQKLRMYPPAPERKNILPRWEKGHRVACTEKASAYYECSGTVVEVTGRDGQFYYLIDWDGWAEPCQKPERLLEPVCVLCNAPESRHPSSICQRNVT